MFRVVCAVGLVACMCGAIAPETSMSTLAPKTADGSGHFRFGENDRGNAMFDFSLDTSSGQPVVRLYVGAEIAHDSDGVMFPDYAIKLNQVDRVEFRTQRVEFSGWGLLTGQLYYITVEAFDGGPTGQTDWIHVTAVPDDHDHMDTPTGPFEAKGDLRHGDIVIGGE